MKLRDRDLYQLRSILEFEVVDGEFGGKETITDAEQWAFGDMLEQLQLRQAHALVLTERQRKWVLNVCERLGINPDPPDQRKPVPTGKPVELAPVLRNLPKRPPGRS